MNLMSAVFAPGLSTVERGSPVTDGATVVVVVDRLIGVVVVVVVREEDFGTQIRFFGTQIRFLPTKTQTCAAPPMVRTAPTRAHWPVAARYSLATL